MTTQRPHKHWLENGQFDGTKSEVCDPERVAGAVGRENKGISRQWERLGDWRLKPSPRWPVMAITLDAA